MAIRRFNGTSDELRCSIGAANLTGAFTIAVLARPQAEDEGTLLSFWDATTERVAFGLNAVNQPRLKIGGTTLTGAELGVEPAPTKYGLWAVTKAAGTAKPRWHHFGYGTSKWTHADDSSTIGDPTTQSGGNIRFGNGTTLGFEQADIASGVVWAKVLPDAELESLLTSSALASWLSLSPAAIWLFAQESIEVALTDSTGNAADQSAIAGTSVLAEAPPIPYYGASQRSLLGVGR